MASSFPTSLDTFTNPTSADALDSVSVPHATQHSDLNDAVEALQAKVGADGSAVTSSHDYKIAQLEALGTYTDYSGTVTFTNFTLGNGTVGEARYAQVNDFVHYYGRVSLGSTSAVSGTIGVSLPVNIGPTGQPPWGFSRFLKAGVGWWLGSVDQSSQTQINLHSLIASSSYLIDLGGTSATVPFTWTPTGDQFLWNVFYKAA